MTDSALTQETISAPATGDCPPPGGPVAGGPAAGPGVFEDGFAALRTEIRAAGLLQPRPYWYARSIAAILLALAGLAVVMVLLGPSWWQLAAAVVAAVLSGRCGFMGHDAGHQQVARSRRVNRWTGLLHGNLMTGMSYDWWNRKHNKHHAHPNDVARDPDVGPGVIVWTTDQAATRQRPVTRWLTRHQAALFFPLLLLEGLNLNVSSIQHMREKRTPLAEKVLLGLHYVGYLGFVFAVMPPWHAVAFIAVHQGLFGLYLGSAFAPNHKGMPMPPPGVSWGHLRQQVVTSRNVTGAPFTDWALGGLNYQIEHHLFSSMPRPNLRAAQPIVRRHCEELGLPYVEHSALRSYQFSLRHLAEAGRPPRSAGPGPVVPEAG
jgi:fatty acid desaturase